jgi:CubicO group peptidase (beta-lactamase class C family)
MQLKKIGLFLVVFLVVLSVAYIWATRSFWDRYLFQPEDPLEPSIEWYSPLTNLDGAQGRFLPVAEPGERTIDQAALELAAEAAEAMNSTALIIVHKGVVQFEAYWQGWSRNYEYSAHSKAKTLLALMVGIAINDGHIGSVSDPVGKYLSEWKNDPRGQIKIEDLLHMASGLSVPRIVSPFSDYIQINWGSHTERTALGLERSTDPGTTFDFHNGNLILVGVVLERATGVLYPDYVSQKLWKPLGNDDAKILMDRKGGRAKTSCCILATPADWLRVAELVRRGGDWSGKQLVPTEWIERMRKPSPAHVNYGMQLFIGNAHLNEKRPIRPNRNGPVADPYVSEDLFYFDGAGAKRAYIVPSEDLTILRLGYVDKTWDDSIIPNIIATALKPK